MHFDPLQCSSLIGSWHLVCFDVIDFRILQILWLVSVFNWHVLWLVSILLFDWLSVLNLLFFSQRCSLIGCLFDVAFWLVSYSICSGFFLNFTFDWMVFYILHFDWLDFFNTFYVTFSHVVYWLIFRLTLLNSWLIDVISNDYVFISTLLLWSESLFIYKKHNITNNTWEDINCFKCIW